VAASLDAVAWPRLSLGPDHGGALGDPAERLTQVAAAADEGHLEAVLVDVVLLVGRRQHLGFVDVVDAERLEDLSLDEVADPGFRHHRDGHCGLDLLDQAGVAHPRDAAVPADVGGHPLERHHRARPGLLGDAGVLGGDDVHDHAALQHLGQAGLHLEGRRGFGNGLSVAFAHCA